MKRLDRRPKVISIAAVSGGGKTTVTKGLEEELHNVVSLFFDEYTFENSPEDLIEWVEKGADYNEWNLEPLILDVQHLLHYAEKPPTYILLDYPFSYKNKAMREFIDFSVYIDTSLDVAMVRRLLRDYPGDSILHVHNDLNFYLNHGRKGYLEMEKSIKPNSDFVINGDLSSEVIVNVIIDEMRNRGLF
ncbi:hypothetical protein [Halobacillus ihumii]|uniref:hypothetical protein n=1 Tax=Halobacillus ihumii TaxID=2686092 RepID=UPI0013D7510A|nr:hypothetical protein [Halobacillus ihumii]